MSVLDKKVSEDLNTLKSRIEQELGKVREDIGKEVEANVDTMLGQLYHRLDAQKKLLIIDDLAKKRLAARYVSGIWANCDLKQFKEGIDAIECIDGRENLLKRLSCLNIADGIYKDCTDILQVVLTNIHWHTTIYAGDSSDKIERYLNSAEYTTDLEKLTFLISKGFQDELKRLAEMGRRSFDHRNSSYSLKVPQEVIDFINAPIPATEERRSSARP